MQSVIKKTILTLLCLTVLLTACNFTKIGPHYTFKENIKIIHSNTARFNLLMGIRSKEVIRLCNLARREPELLKKYIEHMYGEKYSKLTCIQHIQVNKNKRPMLRPSYLLYGSAKSHAIISGFSGYEGHRGFTTRIFMFCNLNGIFVQIGENCTYGNWRAIDQFTSWMASSPHRKNILDPNYFRIGHGSFPHIEYRTNSVQCFSGPKVLDVLLRPQVVFKK